MDTTPNIFISFAAGLLSFLSPCVLPLIPSYIGFIGGASLADLRDGKIARRPVIRRTVFFVLGFSAVFILLGILLSGGGILLGGWSSTINLIAGFIVITLGLNIIFDFWKVLNIEKRFQIRKRPTSGAASFLVGMAFGGGWSPCIGPILAAILFLAGRSGQLAVSILYLSVYSLGLGIPFLLAAIFISGFARNSSRILKHAPVIKTVSGILLILIGLSIAFGKFQQVNTLVFSAAYGLEEWSRSNPVLSRIVFGVSVMMLGVLSGIRALVKGRNAPAGSAGRPPYGWIIAASLLVGTAVLELSGVVRIENLVSSWLSFQGI